MEINISLEKFSLAVVWYYAIGYCIKIFIQIYQHQNINYNIKYFYTQTLKLDRFIQSSEHKLNTDMFRRQDIKNQFYQQIFIYLFTIKNIPVPLQRQSNFKIFYTIDTICVFTYFSEPLYIQLTLSLNHYFTVASLIQPIISTSYLSFTTFVARNIFTQKTTELGKFTLSSTMNVQRHR